MASITPVTLFEALQLATAASLIFTATTGTVRVDKVTCVNTDNAPVKVSFYWVGSGASFGAPNLLVSARPLQINEAWDAIPLMGHVFSTGDALYGLASVAAVVNVFGSGNAVSA